jgi:hypothetical protein
MNRAGSDVGLIFIAYNLRRIMNILDREAFRKYQGALLAVILRLSGHIRDNIRYFNRLVSKNLQIEYMKPGLFLPT